MKLWLADFQVIGGVFIPMRVAWEDRNPFSLYGKLQFSSGEEFFIKVRIKHGSQPYITKVCSTESSHDAFLNTRRLLDIRSDALNKNINDVCRVVRNRRVNVTVWVVMFITYIVSAVWFGLSYIANKNMISVLLLAISIGCIVSMFVKRHMLFRRGCLNAEV